MHLKHCDEGSVDKVSLHLGGVAHLDWELPARHMQRGASKVSQEQGDVKGCRHYHHLAEEGYGVRWVITCSFVARSLSSSIPSPLSPVATR